ncbi:MAG: YjjG family noncanonical pyrimidine nucleotidase [Anaerolineaceae bacterium]|nr:YjjG family noncanonical pyrimidine nucleotidase [Anaerolineaceae bacterium]
MKYQWLLFDADGTLFDFDKAETSALQNTFKDYEIIFKPEYHDRYHQISIEAWQDFEAGKLDSKTMRYIRYERLFKEFNINLDALTFGNQYLKNLGQQGDLCPGVPETIHALHSKYRMAIITNGLADVQRSRFAKFDLLDRFEEIFISEEMGVQKPDPAYFDQVFKAIGNPPKDKALIIGDSLSSDMQGGKNYGVDTCWVNPQGKSADPDLNIRFEIMELKKLLELL